jgi:cysteine desulfurase
MPIIEGGGHERGLRSGTLNVPGIVGFAKAVEISLQEMETEQGRIRALRDSLYKTLKNGIPGLRLNGNPDCRLAGNLNVCVPGIVSESLIIALADEVAFATGSACSTASVDPSHVLKALGLSNAEVHASFRLGLGRHTNAAEVQQASHVIVERIALLRGQTPQ